jgi:cell division protein FtsB
MCKEEESNKKCAGCFQLAGPLLLEEVKKVRKENTEVNAENKTLKDQVGGLRDYVNFLKEQLRWAQVKEQSRK